jgi:hypothetical protein
MKMRPKLVAELDVLDGIAATRGGFPYWYVNEPECQQFVLALKSYHRKYDEKLQTYSSEPVHDWSSHYADMWRYANITCSLPSLEEFVRRRNNPHDPPPVRTMHYGFSLNDIWDCGPVRSR